MKECNMNEECAPQECCCSDTCECKAGCQCQEDGCPVEMVVSKWKCAFGDAVHQVMKEKLKVRIEKAWGSHFDAEADAVVAAMSTCWQAKALELKASMAHQSLKESILKNWIAASEGSKNK